MSWEGWKAVGGVKVKLTEAPTVVSRNALLLDIFTRDTNHTIVHNSFDGSNWSKWESIGGPFQSQPAVVSQTAESLDVFVVGMDSKCYHQSWTIRSGWNGKGKEWNSLGGAFVYHLTAVSRGSGRLHVFGIGTDSACWHNSSVDGGRTWTDWVSLDGILMSPIAATSWGTGRDDRIDIFGIGTDSAVWQNTWNGVTWDGWSSLGGLLQTPPSGLYLR